MNTAKQASEERMFKARRKLIGIALLMAAGMVAHAATLALIPADGAISGSSGSTIGWGFTIENDTDFLQVTSAAFAPMSSLGIFTDFISGFQSVVVGPAPESPSITQQFDNLAHTGIGSFSIDSGATAGEMAIGQIVLTFDLYGVSPNDPNFNPDTDTISTDNLLSADAQVTVAASTVPEPVSFGTVGGALLSLALCRLLRPNRERRRS
jgi:hypothetical protein